ncbi:hypothetical protein [Chakrabartyella piscis]|uniref:hypothetical protein n=1 Tax=Chakrabartyella piscis TaxID=2918914 RepID=UPI0029584A88|nr:hypothetical protein [Chakrabartyella piscis]
MRKYEYKDLSISDLYINPENYRYINDANDEIDAVISMFNVNTGTPVKEMYNLAKDIVEDGLNPFEVPIACYDDDLKKYVVFDGNRRITCIKLMTQYKDNKDIAEKIPSVKEIYKLNYDNDKIQCVVYTNSDDAKHFLYKIHQDVNEGIGRKQWDYQAKMKADAAKGNKSKTYSIVEFLKNNPSTDKSLISDIDNNRWISKLERVVGFAKFKETYNITFGINNSLIYKDSEEQVLAMMSKLVYDLIHNSATNNFRFKSDFENYVSKLNAEFKTQIVADNNEDKQEQTKNDSNSSVATSKDFQRTQGSNDTKSTKSEKSGQANNDISNDTELPATGTPRTMSKQYFGKVALKLGKVYATDDYDCLNEKGKQMIMELEGLNIKEYPVASAALCRALLECVLKLWMTSINDTNFDSGKLPTTYNLCLTSLRNKGYINDKEHKVLKAEVNKANYIDLLNTWIHSETSACVSETNLISGWKNTRLLIEKYIDKHKK